MPFWPLPSAAACARAPGAGQCLACSSRVPTPCLNLAAHAGDRQHLEIWPGGRAGLLCHRAAVPAQPGQRRPPRDLRRAVLRNRPLPVRVRRAFMSKPCCAPALRRFSAASAACCLSFMLSSVLQLLCSTLAGHEDDQLPMFLKAPGSTTLSCCFAAPCLRLSMPPAP